MAYQVGNGLAVSVRHPCRDLAGELATGQAANIDAILTDPDGSVSAVSVTVAEIGSTGWYLLTLTPTETGVWNLQVTNPDPPNGDGLVVDYPVQVVDQGVVSTSSRLLTTVARVKRRIGYSGSDQDTLLGEIVSEISVDIQCRAGRWIGQDDYSLYLSGDGSRRLNLRQGPLVSVTSVQLVEYSDAGDGSRQETLTTVDPYEYVELGKRTQGSDGPGILRRLSGAWIAGVQNYKVVFAAGYETLPEDLVGHATTACAALWFTRQAAGLRGKQEGDWSVETLSPAQLDEALDRIAAPYRYDWGIGGLGIL